MQFVVKQLQSGAISYSTDTALASLQCKINEAHVLVYINA